jgi:hypothetical protein
VGRVVMTTGGGRQGCVHGGCSFVRAAHGRCQARLHRTVASQRGRFVSGGRGRSHSAEKAGTVNGWLLGRAKRQPSRASRALPPRNRWRDAPADQAVRAPTKPAAVRGIPVAMINTSVSFRLWREFHRSGRRDSRSSITVDSDRLVM